MKKRVFTVSLFLLIPVAYLLADEFVIQREKKQSPNKLREQCCQALADLTTSIIPNTLHAVADVQKESLVCVGDFIESSKKATLSTMSREELTSLRETIDRVSKQLHAANEGLVSLKKMVQKK